MTKKISKPMFYAATVIVRTEHANYTGTYSTCVTRTNKKVLSSYIDRYYGEDLVAVYFHETVYTKEQAKLLRLCL